MSELELKQEEQVIYDEIHSEKEESCKNKSNPKRTPLYRHRVSVTDIQQVNDYDSYNLDVLIKSIQSSKE
jgi:hypothetical protein